MRNVDATESIELPQYPEGLLRRFDELMLVDVMIDDEDRVPRNFIDECARRGSALLDEFESLLESPLSWASDRPTGEWWLILHMIHILGLMPGERAGQMLKRAMMRLAIDDDEDDTLGKWVSGHWPALFANKPHELIESMEDDVRNRNHPPYLRTDMFSVLLSQAHRDASPRLESLLDLAASLAAEEDEYEAVRELLLLELLQFPRERHRALLETYAREHAKELGTMFDFEEVAQAFAKGSDDPEWTRLADPWRFYAPDEIAARQQRWLTEPQPGQHEDSFDDLLLDDFALDDPDARPSPPYVRAGPKVSRNDPCPCGSGRKYKKCCLRKSGLTQ